jgi:hypothetical protein
MRLRFSLALISGAVIAASTFANATSAPNAPITIEGLARVEGTLSYCTTVDPKNSALYEKALDNILSHHSSSEIKSDQSSSRYTYAMGVIDQEMAKLPVSTVVSSCKNFIGAK